MKYPPKVNAGTKPTRRKPSTPGYYNNEGHPAGRRQTLNMGGYPLGPVAFFEYIEAWRSSGDFQGLSFR